MSVPEDLKESGRAIWEAAKTDTLNAAVRAMVHNTARLADRLDRMHAMLNGREDVWLQISMDADSGDVVLVIDKLLAEARQYALAYRQCVSELRSLGVLKQDDKPGEGGGLIDELQRQRQERERRAASGS